MIINISNKYKDITKFCSTDEFKTNMNDIFIVPEGDKWFAYATDGFKGLKVPVNAELYDNDYLHKDKWENGFIISKNIVDHHLRNKDSAVKYIDVPFDENNSVSSFCSNNEKVVGSLVNNSFPPIQNLYEQTFDDVIEVGINTRNILPIIQFDKDAVLNWKISPWSNMTFITFGTDEAKILFMPVKLENGVSFINKNKNLEIKIESLKDDLKLKLGHLQDIINNRSDGVVTANSYEAEDRTREAIRTIKEQIYYYEVSKYGSKFDILSTFCIEDIAEAGFDVATVDIDEVLERLRDAFAHEYFGILRNILESLDCKKKVSSPVELYQEELNNESELEETDRFEEEIEIECPVEELCYSECINALGAIDSAEEYRVLTSAETVLKDDLLSRITLLELEGEDERA